MVFRIRAIKVGKNFINDFTLFSSPYIYVKLNPSRQQSAVPPPAFVRSEQEIKAGEVVTQVNQKFFGQLQADDEVRVLAKLPDFSLSYGLHYADKKVGIEVMKV